MKAFSEGVSRRVRQCRLRLWHGCRAHCKGLAWRRFFDFSKNMFKTFKFSLKHCGTSSVYFYTIGLVLALSCLRMRRGELACDVCHVCHHLPQWLNDRHDQRRCVTIDSSTSQIWHWGRRSEAWHIQAWRTNKLKNNHLNSSSIKYQTWES